LAFLRKRVLSMPAEQKSAETRLGTAEFGARPARSWDCLSSKRKLSARGLDSSWKCKCERGISGAEVLKNPSRAKAAELANHLTIGVAVSRVPDAARSAAVGCLKNRCV
jgi:hypothetical protein